MLLKGNVYAVTRSLGKPSSFRSNSTTPLTVTLCLSATDTDLGEQRRICRLSFRAVSSRI